MENSCVGQLYSSSVMAQSSYLIFQFLGVMDLPTGCKSSSSFDKDCGWCLCICLPWALLLHDGHNKVILGHKIVLGDKSCESSAQIRFILEQRFQTVCILHNYRNVSVLILTSYAIVKVKSLYLPKRHTGKRRCSSTHWTLDGGEWST